jgi:hypothetical protein
VPSRTTTTQPVTPAQKDALAALHAYLDAQAVKAPGAPDTPALREARQLRTVLEQAWGPDLWPPAATA